MKRISIQFKLFSLALIVILTMSAFVYMDVYRTKITDKLQRDREHFQDIETVLYKLNKIHNDYATLYHPKFIDDFEEEYKHLSEHIEHVSEDWKALNLNKFELVGLYQEVADYKSNFATMAHLQQDIGKDQTEGIRKKMRDSLYALEAVLDEIRDPVLYTALHRRMLMTQRTEKDLILRRQKKYIGKFDRYYGVLEDDISKLVEDEDLKSRLHEASKTYRDNFRQLTQNALRIGLTYEDGLRGKIGQTVKEAMSHTRQLSDLVKNTANDQQKQINRQIIGLAGVISLIILGLIFSVIRSITTRLRDMTAAMTALSAGDLDVALPPESEMDEIGEMARALHVFRDNAIAQAKSEEALRRAQKMQAVGQLTGGIAHDFNNLLGVIMGNLQLLQRKLTNSDETFQRWVNTALENARRGADLTQKLLQFSRKESQAENTVSINKLISESDVLISKTLTKKIELQMDLAPDLWLTRIDPGDFSDALLNLVINARDAMASGGALTITTTNRLIDESYSIPDQDMRPGPYILLKIADTGSGMSKKILDQVFEPFFTTKEAGRGTGLGLSMVFGFVERSGGFIQIKSEVGIGTTFSIYLPQSEEDEVARKDVHHVDHHALRGDETILIVDDEVHLVKMAEDCLHEYGYKTLSAYDGKNALSVLESDEDIQLLFSDVIMPGRMNGFQLAQTAVGERPDLKVLLTSGFTNREALEKDGIDFESALTKKLANNMLPKPYDLTALATMVRKTLDSGLEE